MKPKKTETETETESESEESQKTEKATQSEQAKPRSEETGAAESSEQQPAEAEDFRIRYLRSVADLENFRKRVAKEKALIIKSANASLIESLLPVIDTMKLGLEAAEKQAEASDIVQGFNMVLDQLNRVLAENGLEEIIPDGAIFDPNLHESIAYQPSDTVPLDHVIQTVRTGYRLNERLIRAANVIVSSGTNSEA